MRWQYVLTIPITIIYRLVMILAYLACWPLALLWSIWYHAAEALQATCWRLSGSRAASVFRFICPSRVWWRFLLQATLLVTALVYAVHALLAEWEASLGFRLKSVQHFERASTLFPLARNIRTNPAYAMIMADPDGTYAVTYDAIREALRTDPGASDLWFNLARMHLKHGQISEYTDDMAHLQRLTPHAEYEVVIVNPEGAPNP